MAKKRLWAMLLSLGLLANVSPAWAYLDPSSGSMLLQVLVGGVATGALIVKSKWAKIKSIFSKKSGEVTASLDDNSSNNLNHNLGGNLNSNLGGNFNSNLGKHLGNSLENKPLQDASSSFQGKK